MNQNQEKKTMDDILREQNERPKGIKPVKVKPPGPDNQYTAHNMRVYDYYD